MHKGELIEHARPFYEENEILELELAIDLASQFH